MIAHLETQYVTRVNELVQQLILLLTHKGRVLRSKTSTTSSHRTPTVFSFKSEVHKLLHFQFSSADMYNLDRYFKDFFINIKLSFLENVTEYHINKDITRLS